MIITDKFLYHPPLFSRTLIERLLPHRPPFLMIDSVNSYTSGHNPSLFADLIIRSSDPLFSGDETVKFWPSMYVIEGLGQCCNLLSVISTIEQRLRNKGYHSINMEAVLRVLESNKNDNITNILTKILEPDAMETMSRIGLLGSVEIKISGRASMGQSLLYKVQQSQMYGALSYFKAYAFIGENQIAYGTLVGASGDK